MMRTCKLILSSLLVLNATLGPSAVFQNLDLPISEDAASQSTMRPEGSLHHVQLSDLGGILENSCALLGIPPSDSDPSVHLLLAQLTQVFQNDAEVFIGRMSIFANVTQIAWKPRYISHIDHESPPQLVFYAREVKDRTCLLVPQKTVFQAEPYIGRLVLETVVQFVNEKCGVFRTVSGDLSPAGLFHQHIMHNLYKPEKPVTHCKRIKLPLKHEFIQEYLLRSRPVVIEGALEHWPAMRKWTTKYFYEKFGSQEVHIKLTPNGNFEGVESGKLWAAYRDGWIPANVRSQLSFPDLVVVRPATREMKFSDFLDIITAGNSTYSAYLEYTSIPYYMPALQEDIAEMTFIAGLLQQRHLNIWLSDGNTLGKLHFDPYDNFLCQIFGEKHLTLFDPHHNEDLYEAHIPEAILGFSPTSGTFYRHTLLQSTSMVMSPVDIANPDLERFPNFAQAHRLECILRPGDVLFMPAFWWHEVQSYPDSKERRNLAVNYWYEPLLTKEFPCAECRLNFNMFYRHLLYDVSN